jgi:VWFA-related protein
MRGIFMHSIALLPFFAATALLAQDKPVLQTRPDPPQSSAISVNTNLVVLSVVVHDKKGALVNNLTKDDFILKAGGRTIKDAKPDSIHLETIKYFDHDTDVPLTLGLLVDVSRSQRDVLEDERKGSDVFLEKTLAPAVGSKPTDKGYRPADKAFVVQFARPIELLQDVTDARPRLEKALDELGTESPTFKNTDTGDTTDSEGRRVRGGGTSLYDAVYLTANEVQAKQTGRKALVVLTDGVDSGSKESLSDAIEAAQRADTIVYAVYYKGKDQQRQNDNYNNNNRRGGGYPGGGYPGGGYPGGGYPGGGGGGNNPNGGNRPGGGGPSRKPNVDGKQVLDRLCGETGGAVFEVTKKLTVDEILTQIGDELRQQYRLGFTPDEAGSRYGYHQIDLSLKNPDENKKDRIQVRDGYYAADSK